MNQWVLRLLRVVMSGLIVVHCLVAQEVERAGDPELQMTMVPAAESYKLGQPILITIVYSNPSDHDIHYPYVKSNQGVLYKISVLEVSTGKYLERTEFGKEAYYEVFGGSAPPHHRDVGVPFVRAVAGGSWVILPPHQVATVTTDLNHLFKFVSPGSYRIETIREPAYQPTVEPITIVVAP